MNIASFNGPARNMMHEPLKEWASGTLTIAEMSDGAIAVCVLTFDDGVPMQPLVRLYGPEADSFLRFANNLRVSRNEEHWAEDHTLDADFVSIP